MNEFKIYEYGTILFGYFRFTSIEKSVFKGLKEDILSEIFFILTLFNSWYLFLLRRLIFLTIGISSLPDINCMVLSPSLRDTALSVVLAGCQPYVLKVIGFGRVTPFTLRETEVNEPSSYSPGIIRNDKSQLWAIGDFTINDATPLPSIEVQSIAFEATFRLDATISNDRDNEISSANKM